MQDNKIQLIDKDGKVIDADILFTYHSDENNKDYVVFQLPDSDEAIVECYKENKDGTGEIYDIETDAEYEMINKLFLEFIEQDSDEE